ncbi:MAG: FAD:protein FMN transferase [Candidatus Omnitrophota bacterium]
MTGRPLVLSLIIMIAFTSSGCDKPSSFKRSRLIMDTIVNIKVSEPSSLLQKKAVAMAFDEMEELEKVLSKYDEASEVALINRMHKEESLPLGRDTAFLLSKALDLYSLTEGAFDVTVSELVDLWNDSKRASTLPSSEEIEEARTLVGSGYLRLDVDGTLTLKREGVKLDLSGIAKGYAVDRAVAVLKDSGIESGIVDAGGDIYCFGPGPRGKEWRVGVRNPRDDSLIGALSLRDAAVATSGDYYRFFIIGEKRYSHIIDPRTGSPVSETPMSVTVIAPDCLTADAMATAITVMGPSIGLDFAENQREIEAIIISKDGDGFKVELTSGAKALYEEL